MDPSLIVALSALALSILSPIASAWINGHYHLKEKTLELEDARRREQQTFYQQHRAEVIERYISTAGAVLRSPTHESYSAYCSAKGEIYWYVPMDLWETIDTLDSLVEDENSQPAITCFNKLCKELSLEDVRPQYQPEPKRNKKK